VLPVAAAIVLTAVTTAFLIERWSPAPARGVVRLSIPAPDMRLTASTLAVAPGGAAIAYGAQVAGEMQLMVRRLDEFEAHPLETTRGLIPNGLTFSPDGASLAFFGSGQIRRIDLRGGPPVTICDVPQGSGGISWRGNSIMFASGNAIYRVADTGGTPEAIATFDAGELVWHPQALDDAGTLLYHVSSGPATTQVVLQTPSGSRAVVADDAVNAFYVAPDRIAFVRNGTLMAMRVDLRTGQAVGSPVPLVEGITRLLITAATFHVAVSTDGTLVYVPGALGGTKRRRLAFVQPDGQIELLALAPHFYGQPRLSPDGRQLAVESDDGKEAAVWVGPVAGNVPLRRLTFEGRNLAPIWTRDGQYVAFQSDREGDRGVFLQRADGSSPAVRMTKADPDSQHVPESWSPDDRLLTLRVTNGRTNSIWIAGRDGTEPKPLVQAGTRSAVASAFSPDGRWVAYGSNELGPQWAVFVQPFPVTGVKYQLTTQSSSTPVWSTDGKQLYFAFTNQVFRADVHASGGMSLGPSTKFETSGSFPSTPPTRHFDVTADGKRFLVVLPEGAETTQRISINVVLNWAEELNAKLPK
jgi:Tol biopolymer transport system component